jgi:peptidyl-prolyl cis-trans isomerase SurA
MTVLTSYRPLAALAGAALLGLIVSGLPIAAPAQEQSIKVLVNDDPISDYDIEQRERFLALTTQQQPSPALKKEAIDLLIDERLQMQQGKKENVTADDANINRILSGMASKNNLTIEGLTTALARGGVNIKTLKDRIRAQLVWQEVVRGKFRRDIQVGDVDIDKALAESAGDQAEGASPGQTALALRQVKFTLPSGADQRTIAARLAAAEALRARFRSCSSVDDLAKGVDGATVKSISDAHVSSLVQPARLLVTNAKVGQMTPPTISPSGIELYALCGKRVVHGDDKLREETSHKLIIQELQIKAERFLRDIRQEAFIEYR